MEIISYNNGKLTIKENNKIIRYGKMHEIDINENEQILFFNKCTFNFFIPSKEINSDMFFALWEGAIFNDYMDYEEKFKVQREDVIFDRFKLDDGMALYYIKDKNELLNFEETKDRIESIRLMNKIIKSVS